MIVDDEHPARITLSLIDYGRSRGMRRRRRMRSIRIAALFLVAGAIAVSVMIAPG